MSEANTKPRGLPRWARWLITPLIIISAGAFIWAQLPKGAYSTDLSQIGTGKPALVVTYDTSFLSGMEVMGMMDKMRDDYEDSVLFLVAQLGTPNGRNLAMRHGVEDGAALLFSERGELVSQLYPRQEAQLREALNQAFNLSVPR